METIITVDESRLSDPLKQVTVGRLSSFDFTIMGVPANTIALAVYVGRVDAEVPFAVACDKIEDGKWHCYLSPWCFPNVSRALKYDVMSTRDGRVVKWLGKGILNVVENPSDGHPLPPPLIPDDTYVRNPVTGLYHKVTADVDEYGNIGVSVEQHGEER